MFPDYLYFHAEAIIDKCRESNYQIATAESCTGGLISALFTEIPGSSAVLDRGYVTYSNLAKQQMLNVSSDLIAQYGAVSEQVARVMAEGALHNSSSNFTVAVTGIAGPGGGSDQKPVGLVYIAIAGNLLTTNIHKFLFTGSREDIRLSAVTKSLDLLYDVICK